MSNLVMLAKGDINLGDAGIYSLVAIVLVFVILLIIIGITTLIFKIMGLFAMKKEIDEAKKLMNTPSISNNVTSTPVVNEFDENDEDMVAAVLVASIDYQNEVKKNVKLVSVRKVN